jgi:hypothetical protein
MAGEFDPMGGDLYSIMGGIPGGGPVGAMAAQQMQQLQQQREAAQAQQLQAQAQEQQAQSERTRALIQPEIGQIKGLTGLYGGQTTRLGAETQQLGLSNLRTASGLAPQIQSDIAKYKAETSTEDLRRFEAGLTPLFRMGGTIDSLPPQMKLLQMDTTAAQTGILRDPGYKVFRSAVENGLPLSAAATMYLGTNPEQIKTETQTGAGIKEAELHVGGQVKSAEILAQSRLAVQQSRAEVQRLTAGKTPDAQLSLIDNQLLTETDPSKRAALQDEREFATQRVNQVNAVKAAMAQLGMNKAAIDGVIATMINQGSGGQVNAPAAPVPQLQTPGQPQVQQPPHGIPTPGTVMQGYVFKGGNPADPNSWQKQ